ncbi:hypothetical protein GEV33_002378 [Tenebrio molitor]|uniref:Uncharacterized protein n=1 Tax=Tenebrio molitor TaxID=7067 RepID=A0A8J6HVR0_TENMO|nr:hypothetical protein GEV33_002378 [Tenebrio molitor]
MSRKRSVMKPITDLWWRYCRTNRENLSGLFLLTFHSFFRRSIPSNGSIHIQPPHLVEPLPGEARPGRKRAPTPEELGRRLQLIPGNSTVHPRATSGPTEPRDDQPKHKRGVTGAYKIAPCEVQEPDKPPL